MAKSLMPVESGAEPVKILPPVRPIRAPSTVERSLRRYLRVGTLVVAAFMLGIGGWAAMASIAGAIIAHGQVMVEGNLKKIQHPDGGIIAAIAVKNGDRVAAGDLLVRLDDTTTRADLAVIKAQLASQMARLARLKAERDNAAAPVFSAAIRDLVGERDLSEILTGETNMFETRRHINTSTVSQLSERVRQIHEEINGLDAQLAATRDQLQLSRDELAELGPLFVKGLIPSSRLNQVKRQTAQLDGQLGQTIAEVARAHARVTETEVQITQSGQQFSSDVAKDLRDTQDKVDELAERRRTAEARLDRVEIRAPIDGFIHELTVHTIRGVVAPGEAIMQIVPESDRLIVEAKLDPLSIDQVTLGQKAMVKFSGFDQRTTPEVEGRVSFVTADIETDPRSGAAYYRSWIELDAKSLAALGEHRLQPGMQAEVFMHTRERTVLSYLMKPLNDQIFRAFRER